MDSNLRVITSLDSITMLLVGSFCLLALAKFLFPKKFEEFIMLPFTNKYFSVQGKENKLTHLFNILLFFIQIIVVSLFLVLLINASYFNNHILLFQIGIGYTFFILVKTILEKLIGVVFSIEKLIDSYVFYKWSYRNFISLLLLICHFFVIYSFNNNTTYLIILGLFLLLINLISLIYFYLKHKSILISNFFYFILYLCTLEISPYYVLYKVIY